MVCGAVAHVREHVFEATREHDRRVVTDVMVVVHHYLKWGPHVGGAGHWVVHPG